MKDKIIEIIKKSELYCIAGKLIEKESLETMTDELAEAIVKVNSVDLPPKKHNELTINYMIGDSKGYTYKEADISLNNIFLEIITDALDKLTPDEVSWGVSLEEECYAYNRRTGAINDLEYDLMYLITYYNFKEANKFFEKHGFEQSEENLKYLKEFYDLFVSDVEYSFLSFEDYELTAVY